MVQSEKLYLTSLKPFLRVQSLTEFFQIINVFQVFNKDLLYGNNFTEPQEKTSLKQ